MPTRPTAARTPRPFTLAEAIAEAKAILARDHVLAHLPPKAREGELAEPGSIYAADRDVAVALLARFVEVIEALDPEMVGPTVDLVRLDRELARRR